MITNNRQGKVTIHLYSSNTVNLSDLSSCDYLDQNGFVTQTAGNTSATGANTTFTDFEVGDYIRYDNDPGGRVLKIDAIANNTFMTMDVWPSANVVANTFSLVGGNKEVVVSAKINKVFWAGDWEITRGGANNVILHLVYAGNWDLSSEGVVLNEEENYPLTFTLTGNGSIIVVADKND